MHLLISLLRDHPRCFASVFFWLRPSAASDVAVAFRDFHADRVVFSCPCVWACTSHITGLDGIVNQ